MGPRHTFVLGAPEPGCRVALATSFVCEYKSDKADVQVRNQWGTEGFATGKGSDLIWHASHVGGQEVSSLIPFIPPGIP